MKKNIKQIGFSVSMSVYKNDNAQHFRDALDSLYNQTLLPSEIVLVVDGPVKSDISNVIFDFENKNKNFKVIRLDKNLGHAGARRAGLENCSFEIVALMDSDDLSVRNRFEKQITALLEEDLTTIVGGQIEEFDDDKDKVVGYRNVPLKDKEIKEYMKLRCPMNQVTVMFKKQDVLSVGGYMDWHNNEDYYLWIRMALAGQKFKNIDDVLVKVRVNHSTYNRRGGWRYFKSEKKIQSLMFKEKIIKLNRYIINVSIRFIVQIAMPNSVRKYLFIKLFRRN